MAERKVYVKYNGKGQFFIGVPAKDLTKAEFDSLTPAQQNDVLRSSIYEKAESKKEPEAPATTQRENN